MSWRRLLGFAPVCGPTPRLIFGRKIDPALGFASCRVDGHIAVHHGRGSTPHRITSLRGPTAHFDEWPRIPNPLMGLRRSSRQR